MLTLTEIFNICDYCTFAPCVCGNEPENCADYVQRHGIDLGERKDGDNDG